MDNALPKILFYGALFVVVFAFSMVWPRWKSRPWLKAAVVVLLLILLGVVVLLWLRPQLGL